MVSDLTDAAIIQALQRSVNDGVQRTQSSSSNHGALQKSLVSHLQDPLGRHVGASSSLLTLTDDAFQNVHNLLVELADAKLVSVLVLCFFASLLLQYVLYLTSHIIL